MFKRVACLLILFASTAAAEDRIAFIYYYAWYANPVYGGEWIHWQENGHTPPRDLASSFYPKLGSYSSTDPTVIDQHMRWIAGANLNVLIYSWWGKRDPTDRAAKLILDAAADYNLKVAFLIEPYEGRTVNKICDDIEYLNDKYGRHPATLRIARKTTYGDMPSPRAMFFIYDPDFRDHELRFLCDKIHSGVNNSIILLQSTDATLIDRAHSDGIFAYEAVQNVMHFYQGIVKMVKSMDAIFIPCVAPGFNINRTFGEKSPLFRSRKHGDTYDEWWEKTIAADPEFVAVISFNEWHEGTQIEPAIKMRGKYLSYEDAYKKSGTAAQQSYLRRTARWIDLFQQLP